MSQWAPLQETSKNFLATFAEAPNLQPSHLCIHRAFDFQTWHFFWPYDSRCSLLWNEMDYEWLSVDEAKRWIISLPSFTTAKVPLANKLEFTWIDQIGSNVKGNMKIVKRIQRWISELRTISVKLVHPTTGPSGKHGPYAQPAGLWSPKCIHLSFLASFLGSS